MVKIRIFGSTITSSRKKVGELPTFSDLIFDRYGYHNRDENYRGVRYCSEERILYFLKKIKCDVAVIFHGNRYSEFCPGSTEDFVDVDCGNVGFYDNIRERIPINTSMHRNTTATQMSAMIVRHRNLFYNKDLLLYRHQSAMLMIDGYLSSKNMQAIHCINPIDIPDGFQFKSGIVDSNLKQFLITHPDQNSSNAVTAEGNRIIADSLIEYIEKLS